MNLGLTRVLQIGGREFVVHELSVPELRQWVSEARAGGLDLIGEAIMDVPINLLALMCRVAAEELPPYPSQLEQLVAAAREVNPRFFGLLARLQGVASVLPSPTSTGP